MVAAPLLERRPRVFGAASDLGGGEGADEEVGLRGEKLFRMVIIHENSIAHRGREAAATSAKIPARSKNNIDLIHISDHYCIVY